MDQLAIDEQAIEDDEVLTALESYQNAREEASAANRVSKEAKAIATALLDKLPIAVGSAARIGRFRVERKVSPARDVQFTTAARERISIALIEEED